MKRRDFLSALGGGALSLAVVPEVFARVLIRSSSRHDFQLLDERSAQLAVVGIGAMGAGAARILGRNLDEVSCHEVTFPEEKTKGEETSSQELVTRIGVAQLDLLFIVCGFEDCHCRSFFEGISSLAKESDVRTLLILPEGAEYPELGSCCTAIWPVSYRSLTNETPLAASAWTAYAARHAVETISHLSTKRSLVCIDFADILHCMAAGSWGRLGTGVANASQAKTAALEAKERLRAQGLQYGETRSVLGAIWGSSEMSFDHFDAIMAELIYGLQDQDLVVGFMIDDSMGGNVKVSLLATTSRFFSN